MAILSPRQFEYSENLCGNFASLVSKYLDNPDEGRTPAASVPLENLFRLLQMHLYSAYSDKPMTGILATDGPTDRRMPYSSDLWHVRIIDVLDEVIGDIYNDTPQQVAIEEILGVLRWLAQGGETPGIDILYRVKGFLSQLAVRLR